MNTATRDEQVAKKRTLLKIHRPAEQLTNSARWLINGFPATMLIWTAEEWARLAVHPADAQPFPYGSWGALRME